MPDSKKTGWVRFHRKSLESSVWKNPVVWMVWSWCLLKAAHSKTKFPFNGADLTIEPGQFITGRTQALRELPMITVQQLKTVFAYLKSTSRITIKATNKFSIISIVNWEDYQTDIIRPTSKITSQLNIQQPASNQPATTYKKEKNDKEVSLVQPTAAEEPFNSENYINQLLLDKKPHLKVIGIYLRFKGLVFSNKEVAAAEIKRNVRIATTIKDYPENEIIATMEYLDSKNLDWGLEAVARNILRVSNNRK